MTNQEMLEILALIRRCYKSFDSPDFSFVKSALEERPYEHILARIEKQFHVDEDTDPNDDVSFGYILSKDQRQWVLRISMVGPFAVLLRLHNDGSAEVCERSQPQSEEENEIMAILDRNRIQLMSRTQLNCPVRICLFNAEPEHTRVYQALFSDSEYCPWEEMQDLRSEDDFDD